MNNENYNVYKMHINDSTVLIIFYPLARCIDLKDYTF